MQKVGHDVLRKRAIGRQEFRADIREEHLLVVGEGLDDSVGLIVLLAEGVFWGRAAGEDCQEENLRIGAFLLELRDDRFHTVGSLLSGALINFVVVLLLWTALV